MKPIVVALAALSLLFLAAGCGQSGPLYLPGNPSKLERIPPASSDQEEEEEEEEQGSRDDDTG